MEIRSLVKVMPRPWVIDNNCVKYYQDPTRQLGDVAQSWNLGIHECALWPWLWRYDLRSRPWHTRGLWTIVYNIIQIQHISEELWPRQGFWVSVQYDLDLGDMTWVKVTTHPWVMDNNIVKYFPDPTWQLGVMAQTRILCMCTRWPYPWVKVMTHP